MKQHRFTILIALIIVLASVMRISHSVEIPIPNIDKPVHFAMYAVLTIAALLESRTRTWRVYIGAVLFAIAFGGAMELVQACLPWRSCSLYDEAANAIGAIVGALLFLTVSLIHKKADKR